MARLAPGAPCPCGSGRAYKACCRPYHQGKKPPTPEALMRARYSAYAAGEIRFVMDTTHPDSPYYRADRKAWFKELKDYVSRTQFVALNVIESSESGDIGHVRFIAGLMQNGQDASFEEYSRFERVNDVWLYLVREDQ